jgi:hypothetical protein
MIPINNTMIKTRALGVSKRYSGWYYFGRHIGRSKKRGTHGKM